MATLQEITTKISGLATIMHSQHILFDTKFTSLQTQMDQIQRKLKEHEDQLFHDKKEGDGVVDRGSVVIGGGEASNYGLVYCFYYFRLKLQYSAFNFSLYLVVVFISMLCSIFFFLAFKILLICLKYLTLVPQQDLVS